MSNLYAYLGANPIIFGAYGSSASVAPTTTPWVRKSDWLEMPDTSSITGSAGAFYGLLAVYTGSSNYVALSATTVPTTGYWVDWGDGTVSQSYSSSQTAEYDHVYNDLPSSSYSSGSGNGVMGYRQVIVKLTPSGSCNFTNFNIQKKHSRPNLPAQVHTPWLDLALGGQNLNTLANTLGMPIASAVNVPDMIERVNLGSMSGSLITFASFASNFYSLESVILPDTSKVTGFSSMFQSCAKLQNPPLFDTSKGTTFAGMFNGCNELDNPPLYNVSSGSSLASMFQNCHALTTVPAYQAKACTTFTSMFISCYSLRNVGLIDTSAGNTFTSMFSSCESLRSIPSLNTSAGITFTNMFVSCESLQSVPLLNTANGTIFTTMFSLCVGLQSVPNLNFAKAASATALSGAFNGCTSLQVIPRFDVSSLNQTGSALFSLMFNNCNALKVGAMSGSRAKLNYTSCSLARNELVEIFDYLSITGSTACSITCSGNHGVVDLTAADTASVLAKGWTIKTT